MLVETTINIPFAAKLNADSNGLAYVEHPTIHTLVYGSEAKAKKELRAAITEQIEEGLRAVKNYQTRALGTKEGSVFIVRYHTGGWQYSIIGPGRTHGGACLGPKTFDETLDSARKHAEQSFDGIVWECSL